MKQKNKIIFHLSNLLFCLLMLISLSGCKKQKKATPQSSEQGMPQQRMPPAQVEPDSNSENKQQDAMQEEQKTITPEQLSYDVENKTGKTIYVTSFAYVHTNPFAMWRWNKSPIYEIKDDQTITIAHIPIKDPADREDVYGYLAIFHDQKEAEEAIFELLPEKRVIDLDLLSQLKGKKVVIEVERYGFKGPFFDYDFIKKDQTFKNIPQLDFFVQNNTGKTIYVDCFAYQKKAKGRWIAALEEKDDMSNWRFDKVGIYRLDPGQSAYVDIDTIIVNRDRSSVMGYLVVFDEDEENLALEATYELPASRRKIDLGLLHKIQNKTIAIEIEKYGMADDFVDYIIKPVQRINFSKIHSTR